MNNPTLHVRIISPQSVILDTIAKSVSAKNSQGNFDILALHANFITLVENNPILIKLDNKKTLTYTYPLSIIFASDNQVNIYTYISNK